MQTIPNRSGVMALVLETKPADNGWGAWAEVQVQEVYGPDDEAWRSMLLGARNLRVFVPPVLVEQVATGKRFKGHITLRGGTYSLTK